MTADVDTWPDGRPKERPGFNRAAWDGDKPLSGPQVVFAFATLQHGGVVFERKPDDLDADYTPRGGTVVKKGVDGDGRPWVEVLATRNEHRRAQIVRYRLWVDEIGEYQPPTRWWAHGTARRICRAIGAPLDNTYLAEWEKEALFIAFGLVMDEAIEGRTVACRGGDPTCPCQDGDPCHYEPHGDTPPAPTPGDA